MDAWSSWSKKILDILGLRLHFSQLYVVNCCSLSNPGSNPGWGKLWGPTVLQPLYQIKPKLFHLEIQLLSIRSRKLKSIAWLLGVVLLGQSTLESYHKMTIVREWRTQSVGSLPLTPCVTFFEYFSLHLDWSYSFFFTNCKISLKYYLFLQDW